jgi:hypothetical protein
MPLFLREGRAGSRGVVRRGRWVRRWQASRSSHHVESEAKRRLKQHRSAIDPRVLIFMVEPAVSSQHHQHTRCDSLFVSIDQWPDIEDLKLSRIGKFQNHKFRKLCGAVK